ncbi:hypothetical protein J4460_03515 [Candidatus Woesearchaeota archaeon]|nr:MAG: hypothetical protein QS99_C0009G0047 [archaeon GW2011_AR4]MBS3129717.1 hypothetical protein [Candidatus Woesearchaeota archaeon]HIH37410.1 hypothetical protein [Candidatus Woesearchaeota archaeon]HIH48292.1 hypothetical protein [Candidatus Woesearchaeota archaeon]HIJ02901.1 hypothetical protein [Candidatus Woesearchaeota archaeon]
MTDYLGTTLQSADRYHVGVINPHVAVVKEGGPQDVYSVFYRGRFEVGHGPLLPPTGRNAGSRVRVYRGSPAGTKYRSLVSANPREWQDTESVARNVSLDEALRLGEEKALGANVVLYTQEKGLGGPEEVVWHPDGWEPTQG